MARKVVGYCRVSLAKQIDGFSLEGQRESIRKAAEHLGCELKDLYVDEGKSGKSIDGRNEFQRMLTDIAESDDDIAFVVVFKLSRFGRNARDILNSFEYIKRYGVDLYSIEDGVDTSKSTGTFMLTILSAVAEMERENISAQTYLGRETKAHSGGWNGGFAPYGYKLLKSGKDSSLEVIENRARQIQLIFDLYVNRNMGYSPIAQYLNGHGEIRERNENDHNRVYDDWTTDQIKKILDNPLYTGRIAYGRTRLASGGVQGKTRRVKQDDYILSEQVFEAIISDEIFEKAKIKRSVKGDDRFNKIGKTNKHLLSGICKCPDCGKSMVIDCNQWIDKHGEKKQKHYYSCGHYKKSGKYGSCRKNSVPAEITENEVIQFTKQLLRNEELAQDIKERIGSTVDVSSLDKEIEQISKQITNINKQIRNAENDIDAIIEDDKHAKRKRDGLNRRLDEFYDKIDYAEGELQNLNKTRQTAMQESFTTEAIYKMLMCFDTIYDKMDATERRSLIETMISDVHLYTIEEREQMTNVTYVKDIQYSFPVTDKVLNSMRDNLTTVESVVLMSKR